MDVVSSLMAGRNMRKKPDTMAGRIKGSVMSFRDSVWDAPQALDASSRDEFTCCREADALFMEKDRYLAMYATRIIQMVL